MRESYGRGVTTHTGPESCGAACKGGVEASTGVRASRVLSGERTSLRGADAVEEGGRPYPGRRYREAQWDSARSETPSTYGNTSRENREILCPTITRSQALISILQLRCARRGAMPSKIRGNLPGYSRSGPRPAPSVRDPNGKPSDPALGASRRAYSGSLPPFSQRP